MKKRIIASIIAAAIAVAGAVSLMPAADVYAVEGDVEINPTNFPDDNFRSFVADTFDENGDNWLTEHERYFVDGCAYLIMSIEDKGISDLTGIEYFSQIDMLRCADNQISSIDLSVLPRIQCVDCRNNQISSLTIPSSLTALFCEGNNIQRLDLSASVVLSATFHRCTREERDGVVSYIEGIAAPAAYTYWYTDAEGNLNFAPYGSGSRRLSYNSGVVVTAPTSGCWYVMDNYYYYNFEESPYPHLDYTVMYRLYNPNSGEHFYTGDLAERNNLISLGWNDEGIGWVAPAESYRPVYRLYNSIGGEHHYTTSVAERDMLIAAGWNYEDIGWYSDPRQRVPLYRQYNPNEFANNHNYTTSLDENNYLVSLGWRAEDIGWYGVAAGA